MASPSTSSIANKQPSVEVVRPSADVSRARLRKRRMRYERPASSGRPSPFADNFSLVKRIVMLAGPAMIAMTSQTVINLTDFLMVGRLGPMEIASVAMSNVIVFTMFGGLISISIATQALTARRFGEGDELAAGRVLFNGVLIAAIASLALFAPAMVFSESLLSYFAEQDEIVALGLPYLRLRMAGMFFVAMLVALRGFFNGLGETWVYMLTAVSVNLTNIIFSYMFIFGVPALGIHAYGVTGCGIGTLYGNITGFLIMLGFSLWPTYRNRFKPWRLANFQPKLLRSMVLLAWPTAVENVVMIGSFAFFQKFQSSVGPEHVAVTGISISLFSFIFLPAVGLGQAGGALVGQHLGAREFETAQRVGRYVLRGAFLMTSVVSLFYAIYAEQLVGFFTDDPTVRALGIGTISLVAIAGLFDGVSMVMTAILQSAGLTNWVMLSHVGMDLLTFLPMAYVMSVIYGLGSIGGFIALTGYLFLFLLVLLRKYLAGDWQHVKI